jgi:hypothetical protein
VSSLEVLLIGSLGFFVGCQIINGIMNITTAKFVKRQTVLHAKVREEEARANFDQIEAISIKLELLSQSFQVLEDYIRYDLDLDKKSRKRGPYKPRKPKGIEHQQ